MPSLHYHLRQADVGLLRIFARTWGVSEAFTSVAAGAAALEAAMRAPAEAEAVLARLPEEARAALEALQARQGRLPWAEFVRRFGPFREMGPGRREREKPHEQPISPAEALWYAGWVGRAFLEGPEGPLEFAYIPDELRAFLPAAPPPEAAPPGRPAARAERTFLLPVHDHILDHLTTYLAARRAGRPLADIPDRKAWRYAPAHLEALARALNVLTAAGEVATAAVRAFLEAPRGEALLQLFTAWREGLAFNDLKLMPGVVAEGTWENDPRRAREAVLAWLARLPANTWWSLEGLIAAVHQCCPDFQRSAPGDYDAWYLRAAESGEPLSGWEHWEAVDGALIRFLLTGPLAWLGVVALAAPAKGAPAAAFRLTRWGKALLAGKPPAGLATEDQPLMLRADGRLFAPWRSPRVVRYHIARFAEWEGTDRSGYRFRLTAKALQRAADQGIAAEQVLALLKQHTRALPKTIVQAVHRWEAEGVQATIRPMVVLQVRDPAIIEALRKSRAARFLGPLLGPAAIAVRRDAAPVVLSALAEMGYFGEIEPSSEALSEKAPKKKRKIE